MYGLLQDFDVEYGVSKCPASALQGCKQARRDLPKPQNGLFRGCLCCIWFDKQSRHGLDDGRLEEIGRN